MDTKFTFAAFIDATEYTQHMTYPLIYTDKNREESFNTAIMNLTRMEREEPFRPNKKVELGIYANDGLYKVVPMMIVNDVSHEMGQSGLYSHKVNLIEYTYRLEKVILPETTITRLEGVYEPSLKDVARKILNRATELTQENYTLSPSTESILEGIPSPEWTFNRFTVLEALRMVFSQAKLIPYMEWFDELGHVPMFDTSIGEVSDYSRKDMAYDPETYNSALYSNVENLLVGEDKSIIEPGDNNWTTVRSDTGFEISNNHGMIPTSRPIYKIFNVLFF